MRGTAGVSERANKFDQKAQIKIGHARRYGCTLPAKPLLSQRIQRKPGLHISKNCCTGKNIYAVFLCYYYSREIRRNSQDFRVQRTVGKQLLKIVKMFSSSMNSWAWFLWGDRCASRWSIVNSKVAVSGMAWTVERQTPHTSLHHYLRQGRTHTTSESAG